MLRILISISLLVVSFSRAASAQTQPSAPPDSGSKIPPSASIESLKVTSDTSLASRIGIARRPVPVSAVATPQKRSGICGSITRWKCIAYGTLIGAVAGAWVGDAFAPQPEYRSSGGFFSSEICVANCGTAKIAVYFAAGGSVLGGVGGWIIGR